MTALYVANTDNRWFDFLKANGPFEEVNFWKPSRQLFKAIDEGGLFVFRLKSPRNVIGGYGMLVSSINAPIRLAWESLGRGNGVSSSEELVTAIARYREMEKVTIDSTIGCRLLKDPVFLDEDAWFPVPDDWSGNIVTGKVYSLESTQGARLFDQLQARTQDSLLFKRDKIAFEGFESPPQAAYGPPAMMAPRLGQGAFRLKIADVYGYSCAVSATKVLPALDAAHIIPFAKGGDHSVQNGILLRKDIHAIFDEGFATVDCEGNFRVSKQVQTVFNNGNEYLRLEGKPLSFPVLSQHKPHVDRIAWHRENVFLGD